MRRKELRNENENICKESKPREELREYCVPAFWMAVMGRMLGIKRASVIGDHVAALVAKLHLM